MKKLCFILVLAVCLGVVWGCSADWVAGTVQMTQDPPSEPSAFPAAELTAAPSVAPTEKPATVPAEEPSTEPTTIPTVEQATEPAAVPSEVHFQALQYEDMKAIWLSQFDLVGIYRDGNVQRDEMGFTSAMEQVLDNVKAQGFNTVFLQIRPYADSMYPSEVYPMSAYVVGQLGEDALYDPVDIAVRLAHERELSIHAWVNPMRGMAEEEILQVGAEYALRRWYEDSQLRGTYLVLVDGRWYLNPAYGEVVDLICAGAQEALLRYDFDGLILDDYFYPTTEASFDAGAYHAYLAGGGGLELADYRRSLLSGLVRRLYELTQELGEGRIFGISPAGNADMVVNDQYADVYLWCGESGYLDYICPQVYFGLEHGSFGFVEVCRTYQDMIQTEDVDLIIGMTFGKAFSGEDQWAGSGKDEWKNNKDVLARCLETTLELEHCRGVAVFCYQYFFDPLTGQQVRETAQEQENFVPVFREITWD